MLDEGQLREVAGQLQRRCAELESELRRRDAQYDAVCRASLLVPYFDALCRAAGADVTGASFKAGCAEDAGRVAGVLRGVVFGGGLSDGDGSDGDGSDGDGSGSQA